MTKTQNKKRKGFTIVELVIVVAVIAILAGVLIPTFGGIIESANRSADIQLVAQINTILVIEEKLGGGVNDAVEIQKVIKENGLKLETKSKGAYLWYDIETKKVVLGGLNETGIEIIYAPGTTAYTTIDADRPVLLGDDEQVTPEITEVPKKQFKSPTCPEDFVQGYLFISEKSADGLADAIYALRAPEGDNKTEATKALTDALSALDKIAEKGKVSGASTIASMMQGLMKKTAVITEHGVISIGESEEEILKVILSSETKSLTAQALSDLSSFTKLYVVDLHSGVESIENVGNLIEAGDIDANTGEVNGVHFVYCNDAIDAIDKDTAYGGNIANLIHANERSRYITNLVVKYVYLDKDGSPVVDKDGNRIQNTSNLGSEYPTKSHKVRYDFRNLIYNTESSAYDLKYYSFDISGANSIAAGREEDYFLNEDEQLKIDKNGNLVLYAIFQEVDATFKIAGKCYSNAQTTKILADPNVSKNSLGGDIVVLGTNALLDASLIGYTGEGPLALTIPSGVALWVPCTVTDYSGRNSGAYYPQYYSDQKTPYGKFDKDNDDGVYMLTIASNVTLTNDGYITVDAQLYQQGDSAHFGFISKNSGVLVVNGKIINNGGSRMEAYGVVRTEENGEVEAKSGSTVTEVMSVLDLNGGQTTLAATVNNISPFNNYTIDSIRLPLTVKYGATYTTYGVIEAEGVHSLDFKIAGSIGTPDQALSTNPLFLMHSGAEIVKSYDKNNGIHVTISGEVEDCIKMIDIDIKKILTDYLKNNMSLPNWAAEHLGTAAGAFVDFDGISFAVIPMPIPNFDLTVAEGATLSLSRATYKILPGSNWVVEKGGTLNLNSTMIVYDSFELNDVPSTLTARKYVTRNANGEIVSHAFTELNASLIVKGTLDLKSNAKLAGTIIGGANGAEIKVASTNNLSCPEIKEGGNGKIGIDIGFFEIDITGELDKYTVKDFDWTAKCVQANSARPQAITSAKTYTFDGSIWE